MWNDTFAFNSGGLYASVDNGVVLTSSITPGGKWVRQYDGYLNVLFFGFFGVGGDYTAQIQEAIDFAKINTNVFSRVKSSTVFIPNGSYYVSHLELRDGVDITGESISNTIIYTENDVHNYLFTIEHGPVKFNMSNFFIVFREGVPQGEVPKGCFRFLANPASSGTAHGGLWYSTLKNIEIRNFIGHGIYLDAAEQEQSPLLLHQFNVFENIRVKKENDETFTYSYNALRLRGANAQLTFLNCQ